MTFGPHPLALGVRVLVEAPCPRPLGRSSFDGYELEALAIPEETGVVRLHVAVSAPRVLVQPKVRNRHREVAMDCVEAGCRVEANCCPREGIPGQRPVNVGDRDVGSLLRTVGNVLSLNGGALRKGLRDLILGRLIARCSWPRQGR